MITFFLKLHEKLATWPDTLLTASLIIAAFLIFCIAIMKDQTLLKAIVLAYIIFP